MKKFVFQTIVLVAFFMVLIPIAKADSNNIESEQAAIAKVNAEIAKKNSPLNQKDAVMRAVFARRGETQAVTLKLEYSKTQIDSVILVVVPYSNIEGTTGESGTLSLKVKTQIQIDETTSDSKVTEVTPDVEHARLIKPTLDVDAGDFN